MSDKTLFAEERRKRLVEFITEHRRVTGTQLCEHFDVSSATIRNDLRELDEAGLITRTHGGAIRKTQTGFETGMDSRTSSITEKHTIASLALSQISDGDTLILDAGSTMCELARVLGEKKQLTVVTNDLNVASILEQHPSCDILLVGGLLRKGFHCTVASATSELLHSISVDKAFMGANSFSIAKGASTPDVIHADSKRQMIEVAAKVILLCDHTKLERDSFMSFATSDRIDVLITDSLAKDLYELYSEQELTVLYSELC